MSCATIFILTLTSWLFAFGKDEGQIDEKAEPIKNFIAESFNFFRFPTHVLLEPWILSDGSDWYIPGLMLNVVIWAIFTERLLSIGLKLCNKNK